MNRYRSILLQEYFKHILSFQGYDIYDVEHSVDRYHDRIGKDIFLYEKLLKKGINYLIKNNLDTIEDRYVFRSKRYGFGIQVHWRPDRKTRQFAGFSATTLSDAEMKFFKENDTQLFLESSYARLKYSESLQKELDICGFEPFYEYGKLYLTFEIVNL